MDGGLLDVVPGAVRAELLIVFIVQCHCHIQHLRSEKQNFICNGIHFRTIGSLHFLLLDAVCRGQHVLGGDDRPATEGLRPGLGENGADQSDEWELTSPEINVDMQTIEIELSTSHNIRMSESINSVIIELVGAFNKEIS